MSLAFLGLGYRAFGLQVREAPRLRSMAEEQYLKEVEVGVHRGTIFDRNGAVLAQSVEVDSIYANPRQISGDKAEIARRIAEALRLRPDEVRAKLEQHRYFVWIKRRVTREEAMAVQALGIPGLGFTTEPRRFYPYGEMAGTLLGHSDVDGRGLDGVELALDTHLRGERRTVASLRDALGRELFVGGLPESQHPKANNVVLTIDKFLQYAAERALAEGVEKQRARAGTLVAMDPRTGHILAMASLPGVDPNRPEAFRGVEARNRAVTDPYEPGSTMKVFTVAAALDANVVRPTEMWNCENGRMQIGKHTIHDAHPHGVLSTAEVIQKSSNIGAFKIARRLGRERLHQYLLAFGFGQRTGIETPGERAGRVRPPERWGEIGLATVAFGQGITATPLQLLRALAAIGNGGVLVRPTLLLKVRDATGKTIYEPSHTEKRVLRPEAARAMVEMLKLVTQKGGTATQAAIPGFEVGGKTGTAQKVEPGTGHYSKDKVIGSFMGLVPANEPRLAVIVVIDEPRVDHYGGLVAAPVFRRFAEEALRYLGASLNEAVAAPSGDGRGTVREALGANDILPDQGASNDEGAPSGPGGDSAPPQGVVAGPAEHPTQGVVAGPAEHPTRGVVAGPAEHPSPSEEDEEGEDRPGDEGEGNVRTGDADTGAAARVVQDDSLKGGGSEGAVRQVPDFRGMSVWQALRAAREAGIRIDIIGSGRAVQQSVPKGSRLPDTPVQVTFAPP